MSSRTEAPARQADRPGTGSTAVIAGAVIAALVLLALVALFVRLVILRERSDSDSSWTPERAGALEDMEMLEGEEFSELELAEFANPDSFSGEDLFLTDPFIEQTEENWFGRTRE
jgi:hypothetical protein